MKKTLILSILTSSLMFAESNLEKNFISQGGVITPKIQEIINKDSYFKNVVGYLENPKMMAKQDIDFTDPENPSGEKIILTKALPDYEKALKNAKESVKNYKNPLSAYQGLHLVKTVYGVSHKIKEYKEFSELLYSSQKGICTVYMDYGDVLENGYATKVDKRKALEVYKEGFAQEKCKTGWYGNVLWGKIKTLEMKVK